MAYFLDNIDPRDVLLTLNGFKLYGVDGYGVHWHTSFQQVAGLFDGVASTLETSTKAWSDGYFANVPTREGRTITVEGILYGACPEDLVKSWGEFKAALSINDQTLYVKLGDIELQTKVRQSSSAPLVQWNGLNSLKWSISLTALSSYLYSAGEPNEASTYLPVARGNFIYKVGGYAFEGNGAESEWYFDDNIISGNVYLKSAGTSPSPITARIDGPVENPSIRHSPSGRTMTFGLSLGQGNYLLIDGETKQILVNGTEPLRGHVTRREWSYAQPGPNRWYFTAAEYNTVAKLTIIFRDAFI